VSLTAEINPDVKVGDTFVLEGAYADYADNKALYKDKTMKSHDLNYCFRYDHHCGQRCDRK